MNFIKVFRFQADGSNVNLKLGFIPDYLKLVNITAMQTPGNKAEFEWFGALMGDNIEIQSKVIADTGATGNDNLNYAGSAGMIASLNASTISTNTVYGTSGTVVAIGGEGVTLTAAGFMSDNDIIYGIAIKSDTAFDAGDLAATTLPSRNPVSV